MDNVVIALFDQSWKYKITLVQKASKYFILGLNFLFYYAFINVITKITPLNS
jgi:hypothetical protein